MALNQSEIKTILNNLNGLRLIASKHAIDGSRTESTDLDYVRGVTAANCYPSFCIAEFDSGVLAGASFELTLNTRRIVSSTALVNVVAGSRLYAPLNQSAPLDDSGDFAANVAVGSLAPSTFNIYVFGAVLP